MPNVSLKIDFFQSFFAIVTFFKWKPSSFLRRISDEHTLWIIGLLLRILQDKVVQYASATTTIV